MWTSCFSMLSRRSLCKKLMSRERGTVDRTLLEVSVSMTSFKPKDGSGDDDNGDTFTTKSAATKRMNQQQTTILVCSAREKARTPS